jgi:hypothetical protein
VLFTSCVRHRTLLFPDLWCMFRDSNCPRELYLLVRMQVLLTVGPHRMCLRRIYLFSYWNNFPVGLKLLVRRTSQLNWPTEHELQFHHSIAKITLLLCVWGRSMLDSSQQQASNIKMLEALVWNNLRHSLIWGVCILLRVWYRMMWVLIRLRNVTIVG